MALGIVAARDSLEGLYRWRWLWGRVVARDSLQGMYRWRWLWGRVAATGTAWRGCTGGDGSIGRVAARASPKGLYRWRWLWGRLAASYSPEGLEQVEMALGKSGC